MVSAAASRFAWAFNDPAFSDVLLVLRAAAPQVYSNGTAPTQRLPGDHPWTPVDGSELCDVSDAEHRVCCCNHRTQPSTRNFSDPVQVRTTNVKAACCTPARGGGSNGISVPYIEIRIHAHAVILASHSEMMRSWLSRWSDHQPHQQKEDHQPQHQDDDDDGNRGEEEHEERRHAAHPHKRRRQQRPAQRLELQLAAEEVAAGEAVVRYMYTQSLEGLEDDEELLACMLLADRWLLPDCAAHCAARLQSTPAGSLSWRVRAALLALPPGLAAASPHVAQLQSRVEAALMRTFRCPELMWEEPDNRQLLLSLPAERLVQLLLGRDDLQVTSENVVLSLLSAWLQHHLAEEPATATTTTTTTTATTAATATTATTNIGSSSSSCPASASPSVGTSAGSLGPARRLLTDGPAAVRALLGAGTRGSVDARGVETRGSVDARVVAGSCEGGKRGGEACWGGAEAAGAGPTEVEALLGMVRYGELTPHYRSQVAPLLPGLRGLRLHHQLLAEATAATTTTTTAATAATAAAAASPRLQSSVIRAPGADAEVPTHADPVDAPSACDQLPADEALAYATGVTRGSVGPHHASGAAGPTAPGSATAAVGPGVSVSVGVSETITAAPQRLKTDGNGNGDGGRRGANAAGPAAPAAAGSPRSNAIAAAWAALDAAMAAARTGAAAASTIAAARPLPPAAAAAVVARPPRRLPYNMSRRIEWCRDVRDVRIHLTGVGGPSRGGDATARHQLSPPVFLGGYSWQVATRFAPAGPPASPSQGAAKAAPGLGPAAPGPGRLQLQLGVICTAPAGWGWGSDSEPEPGHATSGGGYGGCERAISGIRVRAQGQQGQQGRGKPGGDSLAVASLTLGVMDAAGRPAWQVVAAPCVLLRAGGGGGGGEEGGAGGGGGTAGDCRASFEVVRGAGLWEYWSGLGGLEPTWWQSGGALTVGGVVRLCGTLHLQC